MNKPISLGLLMAVALIAALVAAPAYATYGGNSAEVQAEKIPVIIAFSQQPGPAEEAQYRHHLGR